MARARGAGRAREVSGRAALPRMQAAGSGERGRPSAADAAAATVRPARATWRLVPRLRQLDQRPGPVRVGAAGSGIAFGLVVAGLRRTPGAFSLIHAIAPRATSRDDLVLGIGDDAAILPVPAGRHTVVVMDSLMTRDTSSQQPR